MAKTKVTPEQWAEQKRLWESDSTYSYSQVADSLQVSKALVGQESKRGGWQKRIGVADGSKNAGSVRDSNFTENAAAGPTRAPTLDGLDAQNPDHVGNAQTAPPSPTAIRTQPDLGPVPTMPEGLSWSEQRNWIEKAVLARQTALNLVQGREIKVAKATVYAAIKAAGGKDSGYNAARTARQVVSALAETHRRESENEVARVRLELGAFEGVRPRPAMIIVHQRPGVSVFGSNDDQTVEARASAADVRARVMEARRIVAEADADRSRKGGWEVTDV